MTAAPKRPRAALYHRVSTCDQDPTLAREELRRAANARDMDIVLDIEEAGSGARNDRPGWQRIQEAARKAEIDVVMTWKLDRAGRSALDLLGNLQSLQDAGVRFVATSQGIDLKPGGDPISRLILTILAGVAEFERSLIVERTLLGLEKARKRGKRLGRPRNRNAPEPATVAALRAQGASWRAISIKLGCTKAAARRAAQRASEKCVENGVPVSSPNSPETER